MFLQLRAARASGVKGFWNEHRMYEYERLLVLIPTIEAEVSRDQSVVSL